VGERKAKCQENKVRSVILKGEVGCYSEPVSAPPKNAASATVSGLCQDCSHTRRIESDRGAVFVMCQLALTDSRFKKYPRLPVLSCVGYERKTESGV